MKLAHFSLGIETTMSFEGPVGGGSRVQMGTKVYINLYDLSPANQYLFQIGFGLHHSGVEIDGREYSFASGGGIFSGPPREAPGAVWRTQVYMGSFDGGIKALNKALDSLRPDFGPDDYHLLRKNCNHFANALCRRLLHKSIPGYVNRLADTAVCCCSCLIPQNMLEQAPVGDPKLSETSRFIHPSNELPKLAFSGQGQKLGGNETSNNASSIPWPIWKSGSPSTVDDLTDRREKARKAALARFEKSNTDTSNKQN